MYVIEDCVSGKTLLEISEASCTLEDFDPDKIFDCGQCFRWNKCEDGSWVGVVGRNVLRVCEKDGDGGGMSASSCRLSDGTDLFHYLDLRRDYAEIRRKLSKCDDKLKAACEAGAGIRILNQDPWETLISFIISQNNNIPRIKKCIEGLCSLFGERIEPRTEGQSGSSFYSFPTAKRLARLSVEELAPLHLGYRDKYIIETARRLASEDAAPEGIRLCDCRAASEGEALDYLLSLTGVGPKVANCILLFSMEKQESFPIDVWVRRVMHLLYGFDEGDTKGMAAYAREHFSPYGGMAQQYLFYYARWKGIDKTK